MSFDKMIFRDSPFFLLGVGRSGTSFTLKLLNSIPNVHVTFEGRMLKEGISIYHDSQLNSPDDFFLFLDRLCISESETNKNKQLIKTINQNKEYLYNFWRENSSYEKIIREIYLLAFGKSIWGDKLLRAEYAWNLLETWPNAKFIVLFRDPRAVYLSQKIRWNTPLYVLSGYWRTHYLLAKKLKKEYQEQVQFLRFEDLIEYPVENIARILDFLQIREEPQNILSSINIDTTVNEKWPNVLSKGEIETIESVCYSFMLDLGYSPIIAKKESEFSRLLYIFELFRYYSKSIMKENWNFIKRKNLIKRFFTMLRNSK